MSSIDLSSLLVKHGLLLHSFAFDTLPVNIKDRLGNDNYSRFQGCHLLLIANVGSTFWTELKTTQPNWNDNNEALNNPVDYFSAKLVGEILHIAELTNGAELLYPGKHPAPLIPLGELANWSTPSPLGLGLHARYGPWFAYRALVKTTSPLPNHDPTTTTIEKAIKNAGVIDNAAIHKNIYTATSPCISCESNACVSACPGNAVSVNASFDISQCANYRVKENTKCKDRCHARNACPVGAEYRYSDEQHAYHMTHALQALIKWANDS